MSFIDKIQDAGSWLSDNIDFEKFQFDKWIDQIKENPEQLVLGAAEPVGAALWSGVTGKDYQPMVSEWGGPTKETFTEAGEAGIDTQAAQGMHDFAQSIAQAYAMNWGAGQIQSYGAEQGWDPNVVNAGIEAGKQIYAGTQEQEPGPDETPFAQYGPPAQQAQAAQPKPAMPPEGTPPEPARIPGATPTF